MMRIKNHPDWPKTWDCSDGDPRSAAEVSEHGILIGVTLSSDAGIHLQVDCNNKRCEGYFLPRDRKSELRALRNTFAAYRNTPMRDVESIVL